jgi:uncharacterized circularly permuted ATP-grasp superfamily protein
MVGHVSDSPAHAVEHPGYRPSGAWDEAFTPGGERRAHYEQLLAALTSADCAQLGRAVQADLDGQGVGFGGGEELSQFLVDPVPRIVDAAEWDLLRRGLAQRVQALVAFVADVYGERAIVAAGVIPARVIDTAEYLEGDMEGVAVSSATYVAGLDLVRGADGRLRVLEDNLRTPSGIAYALAARQALDAHLPVAPPSSRVDPGPVYELMRAALRASAPGAIDDPTVVLLSDGPSNNAWYEHEALAERLGVPLVRPDDLSVRGERLRYRADDGQHDVHVVYRRTDEDRLRNSTGELTWVAEKLLAPLRAGKLSVVNPFGSGVADDKLVHAYVEGMIRFYCGEEPLIESVRTYDLGDEAVRADALARLDELVVKPRSGYGGEGVVVCPRANDADRAAIRRDVERDPTSYIAQELVELSTHPTVCEDGLLEPRHIDLRPFAIGSGGSAVTAPVALTRVAFDRGSLVVNSSQNGGGKDTWLLA